MLLQSVNVLTQYRKPEQGEKVGNRQSPFYLTEVCDASVMTAAECSQHTARHSTAVALRPAADTHNQLTSEEMMRMQMGMQWWPADTLMTQTLAGWQSSGTAATLGVLVVDNQGGWMPAGRNHCCTSSVLCNKYIHRQRHIYTKIFCHDEEIAEKLSSGKINSLFMNKCWRIITDYFNDTTRKMIK